MGIESALTNLAEQVQNLPAFRALMSQGGDAEADAEAAEQSALESRAMWLGALTETAYIIAAADGQLSDGEASEIVSGLVALTDGQVSAEEVGDMLDRVRGAVEEEGQKARFSEIAGIIEDSELRDALYLVACAVAWKDGGIGEKQGLAVRALKDAFGYSEHKHQALLAQARA
jgi:tellurite resistance protein